MTRRTLPPALWTAHEVAAYLCLTARRVLRLARDGAMPCMRLPGGEVMFDPEELAEWLSRCRTPVSEGGDHD
jgi:excisionase family DNA binding protein